MEFRQRLRVLLGRGGLGNIRHATTNLLYFCPATTVSGPVSCRKGVTFVKSKAYDNWEYPHGTKEKRLRRGEGEQQCRH